MEKTKRQKIWEALKAKFHGTYLDIRVVNELNKRGIGTY